MKKWKQMMSGMLVVCMLIAMVPVNASAEGYIPKPEEVMVVCEPMELETSADQFTFFGIDENGNPEIKDTNEIRWIDRIKDLPDYAMEFYDWLIENGDGDGTEDALIDVTHGTYGGTNTYYHPVVTIENISADFAVDSNALGDDRDKVMNAAANEAFGAALDGTSREIRSYIASTVAAFGRDYSEVFWLGAVWTGYTVSNYHYNAYDSKNGTGTIAGDVSFVYYLKGVSNGEVFYAQEGQYIDPDVIYATKAEIEPIIEKVVKEADEYIANNKEVTNSRRSKLDYFNDWLTMNNCYNTSADLNTINKDCRNIVSALRNDSGTEGPVCEAYARAFKVLCDRINVLCVLVTGKANGGEHMWNYVQMNDGKWYAVDVTWNDPTGGNEQAVSGYERDTYFLIGGNSVGDSGRKFSESHTVTNQALVNGTMFINQPILENNPYNNVLAELGFKGAALTLYDNLSVNYKIDSKLFEESGFTNPYVVFSMNGTETVVTDYKVDETSGRYIFDFNNIAPDKMNDTIYATVYADYDGTTCFSETREYKVADYCYSMLDKCSGKEYETFRTLLVDLLNYGAHSQKFTGYKTDMLVNSDLTDSQKTWGTSDDPELGTVQKITEDLIDPAVVWKGGSLVLNDRIEMRFKLETDNIEGLRVQIECKSGKWNIPASQFASIGNNQYYVYFRGLNAAQMRETVSLTVMNGDTAVSNTATYSIESYAYSKQNDTAVAGLAELVKAMMKYGDAAAAYITN